MTTDNKTTTSSCGCLVDWDSFLQGPAAANVSSKSATATLLFDMHSTLGEGILYDDQNQELVWCDILDRKFHRLSLLSNNSNSTVETMELPKMVGSMGLLQSNNNNNKDYDGAYLFAWEDGFQIYNPNTQTALSPMSEGEPVNPDKLPTRLNDGRCDPTGRRFLCGGYFGDRAGTTMKVFNCHWKNNDNDNANNKTTRRTLVHEPLLEGIRVTNSLTFSPDHTTMYFADSPTSQIVAYDYHLEAIRTADLLSNRRIVYQVELQGAVPDGSCVDSEGYLWNATWWNGHASSRVRRIDPRTGQVVFEVLMPDSTSQVSCCCFGGPHLDILFITTAATNRDVTLEPHAGGLYAIKLDGVKGLLEHRFHVS
jgi:L-arabinonolactonase